MTAATSIVAAGGRTVIAATGIVTAGGRTVIAGGRIVTAGGRIVIADTASGSRDPISLKGGGGLLTGAALASRWPLDLGQVKPSSRTLRSSLFVV